MHTEAKSTFTATLSPLFESKKGVGSTRFERRELDSIHGQNQIERWTSMALSGNSVPPNPLDHDHVQLVGGIPTHLKNMTSSIGMMTFPIYGKIKVMFQSPLTWYYLIPFYNILCTLIIRVAPNTPEKKSRAVRVLLRIWRLKGKRYTFHLCPST